MFKEYRILRRYTQEQIAELLEISTRQLQRIENEECQPSLRTLKKIFKILMIEDKDILKYMKTDVF